MSIKTRMKRQQAVNAKTGRDATPVLKHVIVKAKETHAEVKSILPLLTERLAKKDAA